MGNWNWLVKNWKMPRWWKNCDLFDPPKRWRSPTTLWFAGQVKQIPERWPIPMGVDRWNFSLQTPEKAPSHGKTSKHDYFHWNPRASSKFHLFLLAENMQSTRNNQAWVFPEFFQNIWWKKKWSKTHPGNFPFNPKMKKTHFALGKISVFFNPWNLEINDVLIMRLQRSLRW